MAGLFFCYLYFTYKVVLSYYNLFEIWKNTKYVVSHFEISRFSVWVIVIYSIFHLIPDLILEYFWA